MAFFVASPSRLRARRPPGSGSRGFRPARAPPRLGRGVFLRLFRRRPRLFRRRLRLPASPGPGPGPGGFSLFLSLFLLGGGGGGGWCFFRLGGRSPPRRRSVRLRSFLALVRREHARDALDGQVPWSVQHRPCDVGRAVGFSSRGEGASGFGVFVGVRGALRCAEHVDEVFVQRDVRVEVPHRLLHPLRVELILREVLLLDLPPGASREQALDEGEVRAELPKRLEEKLLAICILMNFQRL